MYSTVTEFVYVLLLHMHIDIVVWLAVEIRSCVVPLIRSIKSVGSMQCRLPQVHAGAVNMQARKVGSIACVFFDEVSGNLRDRSVV